MPDVGVIYYADGLINLYRNNIDLSVPVWNGLCSFQILYNRLSRLNVAGSVLLLPNQLYGVFSSFLGNSKIDVISFDTSEIIEKPYALNQQHWFLENNSGNDTWYGAAFAKVFEKYNWKFAVLVPLTNLLIDANDLAESIDLYFREGFEVSFAEERILGAEWAIFDRDLILGLNKTHPEIMACRGALYWALRKPLYPFKVGAYNCPRIRPSISANLRLNSLRALNCYRSITFENFDSPDFSYGDFIYNLGWEIPYVDYAPIQINIEPSSFCNAKCIGCPNTTLKRTKCFLPLETLEKAIKDISDRDMRIVFSGLGEPLLNKDINNIIRTTSNFCSTLQTSLQIMPDANFPYEALDHIRISIDSDTKNGFERVREGCSWENIENFIEKCSCLKVSYETKFPEIGLDYLRRGVSETDILPFLKKWREVCVPVFKGDFFRWPYDTKPEKISWYQISGQADYCGNSKNTSSVNFEPAKRRPCRNAFELTLLSNGDVTACPFDAEGSCFKLGNIKDNTLMEIWNSSLAKVWRKKHLEKSFDHNSYCNNCHDWYKN